MDPHTGVLPGLKVMLDRAARWKFARQQSPLAACPQEVKDGVEDGTKVGGARSPARSRRRQNRRNKSPRRVGQVGVVESSSAHRTVLLARISALSRQTSTSQTPSEFYCHFVAGIHPQPPLSTRHSDHNIARIEPHRSGVGESLDGPLSCVPWAPQSRAAR